MRLLVVVVVVLEREEEIMAIRMRNNNDPNAVCCECGDGQKDVLNMFDLCVGGNIFTICDVCNEAIFYKCLRAECMKNGRVKTPEDRKVMNKRAAKSYKARWELRQLEKKESSKEQNYDE